MGKLATEIDIAAPPERVREILLDFANLTTWHQGFMKSITPLDPTTPLEPGSKLKVAIEGMTFSPRVLVNTPSEFSWRGALPQPFECLGVGDHTFRFEASEKIPGGTKFVHGEVFTGFMAALMSLPMGLGKNTGPGFEGFNADLKRKAEEEGGVKK